VLRSFIGGETTVRKSFETINEGREYYIIKRYIVSDLWVGVTYHVKGSVRVVIDVIVPAST